MSAGAHLGLERMEASSWRPSYGPRRPLLRSDPLLIAARRFVVLGVLLVAFVFAGAALVDANRTYPPVVRTNAGFTFTALDPVTGLPVPRSEWTARAIERTP